MSTILLCMAIALRFENVMDVIYVFIILTVCELIAVIDLKHRIIPNILLLALLITRIAFEILKVFEIAKFPKSDILQAMMGLLVGFFIFIVPALFGKNVGAGDIKFAACIGFSVGVMGLLYTIIFMGLCILAYTLFQASKTLRDMMYEIIPMGPFMTLAMIIVVIWQGC